MELEKYNSKEILENIEKDYIIFEKLFITCFDLDYKTNFTIHFVKNEKINYLLDFFPFGREYPIPISRPIIACLRDLRTMNKIFFVIDFDKFHHTQKEIHINTLIYDAKNIFLGDKDCSNHSVIKYNNRKISYFLTFCDILKNIIKNEDVYYDSFKIYQLELNSKEYSILESILNNDQAKLFADEWSK